MLVGAYEIAIKGTLGWGSSDPANLVYFAFLQHYSKE